MQEIKIKLWLDEAQAWSIEINGRRYEHLSSEIMEGLVEVAMILAEKSLTEATRTRPQ